MCIRDRARSPSVVDGWAATRGARKFQTFAAAMWPRALPVIRTIPCSRPHPRWRRSGSSCLTWQPCGGA
eukprot:3231972-Alexandrium_andersonii.AAC.1